MTSHTWQQRTDRIRLREDDFSWQGAHTGDRRVFIRRSKDDPSEITDLLLGELTKSESQAVITDFLAETGGLSTTRIRVSSIGRIHDNHKNTVATFDHLVAIMRAALTSLGYNSPNAYLEQSGDKWDAVIDVRSSERS